MADAEKLDLLIINPGNARKVYQALGTGLAAKEPPVWSGMIAKFARQKGFSVAILDANAEDLSPAETAARVAEINPRLVTLVVYGHQPSASTQNMPAARAVSNAIKAHTPDVPLLMLGGHVSSLPERTMQEETVDFVCEGEGVYTVEALLHALKSSSSPDWSKVPGLWYRDKGGLCHNPRSAIVKDMDSELDGQAWDLLPMNLYRAHNWHCFGVPSREPYAAIYTTLGCPFNCTFCCINAPFGGSGYRRRSPKRVLAEIDLLVTEYNVRNIKIADELFVLHEDHVKGICDGLIERDYGLNIWAYARVDTIDRPGLLDKLRAAGITWLALGIESGSERVLTDAHKKTDIKKIYEAVEKIHAADIHIIGNYMFGLPEDDQESMRETLDLAKELNCAFANFYSAVAYPGSQLYREAVEKNWVLPESWSGYSQHAYDTLPLPTKYLTGPEVLKFRDAAFNEYFKNPVYQDSIKEKFGDTVSSGIQEILKKELKRKFVPKDK